MPETAGWAAALSFEGVPDMAAMALPIGLPIWTPRTFRATDAQVLHAANLQPSGIAWYILPKLPACTNGFCLDSVC
jgi:hypothetical protein